MFSKFYTTIMGQQYIAKSMEDGKKLVLTKGAFGNGVMPSGSYPVSSTALVSKLGDMALTLKASSATKLKITTQFTNKVGSNVLPAFNLTEMGVYGKIQSTSGTDDTNYPEALLFYGICSIEESDGIPAELTEFLINWDVEVSGDATIETVIDESLVYATLKEANEMKAASLRGYYVSEEQSYSGMAGNYGIKVGKIEGKSVQNGTPTPDAPVEIKSFGDGDVRFISHGYQLFDASKLATKTSGEATVTNNNDGSFTISGSGTMTTTFSMQYTLTHNEFVRLFKAGKFTIDCGIKTRPALFFQLTRVINGESTWVIDWNNAHEASGTFEITQEMLDDPTSTVRISIYAGTGNAVTAGTIKPMMYQDGDGTWEPFRALQGVSLAEPLRSLPNGVCDTYEDGKITRRVGVKIYNSSLSSNFMLSESFNDGYSRFSVTNSAYKPIGNGINAVSDRFQVDRYSNTWNIHDTLMLHGDPTFRFIISDELTGGTIDGFRAWLAENPITVLYELAEPVVEEVTVPVIPSWAPNTAVHHDSELDPASIEWHVLSGVPATKQIEANLLASGWSGDSAPYTQTLNMAVNSSSAGIANVSLSATEEQYMASMKANLRMTEQGNGYIVVTAYGKKPEVDIPIVVQIN